MKKLSNQSIRNPGAKVALAVACAILFAALNVAQVYATKPQAVTTEQTFKGYITAEWDWNANLKEDTAGMIDMKPMAITGLGITFQNSDGSWAFYMFDGNLSTNNTSGANGKWAFDGTGDQLAAYKLVTAEEAVDKKAPVPVTVKGYFCGDTVTGSKSGKTIKVFMVTAFNGVATGNTLPAPVIKGVTDNGVYSSDRIITIENATATLDGITFESGTTVSKEGKHTLVVTDGAGNKTTKNFVIDKSSPVITAKTGKTTVKNNSKVSVDVKVTVRDTLFSFKKSAARNGTVISWPSNNTFSVNGQYVIKAKDQYGHTSALTFTIKKASSK